jgi:hypothetical protein
MFILCGTAVQRQLELFPASFSRKTRLDRSSSDVIIHPAEATAAVGQFHAAAGDYVGAVEEKA